MASTFQIEETASPKNGQRGLWGIVGVLGTILTLLQVRRGEDRPAEPEPPAAQAASTPGLPGEPATHPRRQVKWPAISLEELLGNNPFQLKEVLQQTIQQAAERQPGAQAIEQLVESSRETTAFLRGQAEERMQERAEQLQRQNRVKLTFRGPAGAAALIGDEVVREGDLYEGLFVVAIQPDGVVVEDRDLAPAAGRP